MPLGTPNPRFPGLSQAAAQAAAQMNPLVVAQTQYPMLTSMYPGMIVPTGPISAPVVPGQVPVQQIVPQGAGYARQGFARGAAQGVNRAANIAANQPLAAGTAAQEARVANAFFPQAEVAAAPRPILGGNPAAREIPNVTSLRGDRVSQHMAQQMRNIAKQSAVVPYEGPQNLGRILPGGTGTAGYVRPGAGGPGSAIVPYGSAGSRSAPTFASASRTGLAGRITPGQVTGLGDDALAALRGTGAGGTPFSRLSGTGLGGRINPGQVAGLSDDAMNALRASASGGGGLFNTARSGLGWVNPGGSNLFQKAGGMGSVLRGVGYMGAGQLAGGLIDSTIGGQDGTWDDALAEAARWAGTGAAIGTPFGPWGTAAGGLIGGTIGGVKGWLTGEDSAETQLSNQLEKSQKQVDKAFSTMGLSPQLRDSALAQLQAGYAIAESPEEVKQYTESVLSQVMQSLPADRLQQQENMRREALQASMQAWMGPMLEKAVAQQNFYAAAQGGILNDIADQYSSPTMQGTTRALAAGIPADAAMANQMLLAQIATTPALYGYAAQGPTFGATIDPTAVTGAQQVAPTGDAFTQMLAQQMAEQQAMAAG